MKDLILSVTGLSAGYADHSAVADVSFTLGVGEILCLVGESGCGKSTLLRALIGTPGLQITSGEIILGGTSLLKLPVKARQRLCCGKFGLVSQNPGSSFNPIRSYRKQFIETLVSHGKYDKRSFDDCVAQAFAKLSLDDWERILSCCPYEMSGGMNQRIALALTLLLGQDILLADEPTSALDATIQRQVAEEFRRLRVLGGISQIIVTHNMALAQFLSDRIGVMYAGRMVELGTPDQILHDPRHPYTRALIAAIPTLEGGMPTGLPGQPPLNGPAGLGCEFAGRCSGCSSRCRELPYAMKDVGGGHLTACGCEEGGAA